MDTSLRHALTQLSSGALLRLQGSQGSVVAVFDGSVWITQENDPRDVVLDPGESMTIDRPGLAIVQALRDTKLLVLPADGGAVQAPQPAAVRD